MEKRGERSFLPDSLCVCVFLVLKLCMKVRKCVVLILPVLNFFLLNLPDLRVLKHLPVIFSSIYAIYMKWPIIRYPLSVLKYPSYDYMNLTCHRFGMHWVFSIILVRVTYAQAGRLLEFLTSVCFKEALLSGIIEHREPSHSFSLVKEFLFKRIKNRIEI